MMEETLLDPSNTTRDQFDVFTELDPLGTGKSKPYIDKKDFFQELKNPPKKVLKDLVVDIPKETHNQTLQSTFEISGSSVEDTQSKDAVLSITTDPFGDDPFDKTDPFTEADLCQAVGFSSGARLSPDPFDSSFADFTKFSDHSDFSTSNSFDTPNRKSPQFSDGSPPVHGPLRVSLPPDKQCDSLDLGSPKLSQSPPTSRHRSKYSRIHKQTTSGMIKLPSPKQKGRSRISKQNTLDSSYDRNSPLMDGVSSKHRGMSSSSPPNISFFGEVPPEPPPRPTMTSTLVKPPLLPPKRQLQTAVMKPPPPPQSDDCTHYDYIKNCESLEDVPDDVESPPIPVPARRLRFGGDESAVPNRPSKANLPCQSEPEYYLTPIPLLPPPQKKGASTKNSSPVNPRVFTRPSSNNAVNSLDITLSQLTKTGFSDLAATLNMSPTSLSKMTLQELTKCLQTLSEAQKNSPYTDEFIENGGKIRKNVLKSEQYSALRESIDEDIPPFKAEFESHFNLNLAIKPYSKEDESLFDKYSVFRELLEQEKTIFEDLTANSNNDQSSNEEPMTINPKYEDIEETRKDNMVQTQSNVNKVSKITETLTKSAVDRYAALRDICLDDLMDSKDTDEKDETDPLSDKDDSIAEVTRCDDELDTLTLSRPHSESTDSPTATIKESQSIMESTILEEDASALDDEDGVYDETGDLRTILPTVAESNESITVSDSPQRPVLIKEPSVSSLQSLKGDGFTNNIKEKETDFNPAAEGWAKFDNGLMEAEKSGSLHSDGNISPWSIDSKETPKEQYSPSWPDHPEKKSRKGRRHKGPSVNNWQDDDESEEGWDNHCRSRNTSWNEPSWRENGWSDGDSMYDESSAYDGKHHSQYYTQRRGRRRKISPWRKSSRDPSPWEDDDRELSKDQWEEKRWEETRWQNRPKHRGSSWEEERRRDMYRNDLRREESRRDDSRKRRQSPWSTEGERKSSRESLTWEDDERYSRRNYRDRRRRRWEEGNYPRKDWRDRDQGRRNYHYYRDRSHESPWEDEFSEQGDEDSPRSQTRKQSWSRPRNSENEHYDQRYGRPSSGEDQNIPESNSNWAIKSQTLQIRSRTNKNKKRSQNSPFEDDFSIHNISFGSEKSPGAGSDFSDHGIKPIHQKSQSSPDEVFKRKGFSDSVEFSSQEGRGITPRSRHSPFEDDFTPAETRQTKTRHTTREVSDNRLLFEDQRSGDDVYIDTNMSSSNSDVINRLHSSKIVKKVIKQPLVSRKTKVNASGDHHIDKPRDAYLDKSKAESDTLNEELAIKRTLGKKHEHDLPPEVSSLRKNESLSLKQDSVNIFARSSDPFDDDFFSTESSSCNIEKSNDDKTKNRDPFKWTQAFSAFNFDEESK